MEKIECLCVGTLLSDFPLNKVENNSIKYGDYIENSSVSQVAGSRLAVIQSRDGG